MFENIKGMAGLAGLLKDLPRIKAKIEQVRGELAGKTVSAETGGGAVRVTANGLLHVVSVELDQPLLSGLLDASAEADRAMAGELIAGAVNAALARARELAEREMSAAADELGVPLPPGGLSGLIGS